MEKKIIDGEEWIRNGVFERYVETHNLVFNKNEKLLKTIEEIEGSVKEEIDIIDRYIKMITPITEDSRA